MKYRILRFTRRVIGISQAEDRLRANLRELSLKTGSLETSCRELARRCERIEQLLLEVNHRVLPLESLHSEPTINEILGLIWRMMQEINHRSVVLEDVRERLSMWDNMNQRILTADTNLANTLRIATESARSAAIDADTAMTLALALQRAVDAKMPPRDV